MKTDFEKHVRIGKQGSIIFTTGGRFGVRVDMLFKQWSERQEKMQYHYQLKYHGQVIFIGSDFYTPAYPKEEKMCGLLTFLTLQLGDTDSGYFDNYTVAQWDFTNSSVADEIRMMIYDYETKGQG